MPLIPPDGSVVNNATHGHQQSVNLIGQPLPAIALLRMRSGLHANIIAQPIVIRYFEYNPQRMTDPGTALKPCLIRPG